MKQQHTFLDTYVGSKPASFRTITCPFLVSWTRCFGDGGTLLITSMMLVCLMFFRVFVGSFLEAFVGAPSHGR